MFKEQNHFWTSEEVVGNYAEILQLFEWKGIADFKPQELACKGDGSLMVHWESLQLLQSLRNRINRPLIVHSAFRTPDHNRKVGGAINSYHLTARAFDVDRTDFDNHTTFMFVIEAANLGFGGFGFYPSFIHIDTGPLRTWTDTPLPFAANDN